VRDYVVEVLGEKGREILVPLLFVVEDPNKIPFDTLARGGIIKATHDSGGNHIVRTGDTFDKKAIVDRFSSLIKTKYGALKHEWAYQSIKPKIIAEELLLDAQGELAQDYKLHVFHGKCQFIHTTPKVDGVRTGKRSLFTPDWKQIQVGWKHPQGPYIESPVLLEEMIEIAEKLAAPFDYVRVDLYNVSNRLFFGELTHYHGSGTEKFIPDFFDFEAGKWWNIVAKYWEKNEYGTK
jgi:TupA-like ATPgrasp